AILNLQSNLFYANEQPQRPRSSVNLKTTLQKMAAASLGCDSDEPHFQSFHSFARGDARCVSKIAPRGRNVEPMGRRQLGRQEARHRRLGLDAEQPEDRFA